MSYFLEQAWPAIEWPFQLSSSTHLIFLRVTRKSWSSILPLSQCPDFEVSKLWRVYFWHISHILVVRALFSDFNIYIVVRENKPSDILCFVRSNSGTTKPTWNVWDQWPPDLPNTSNTSVSLGTKALQTDTMSCVPHSSEYIFIWSHLCKNTNVML